MADDPAEAFEEPLPSVSATSSSVSKPPTTNQPTPNPIVDLSVPASTPPLKATILDRAVDRIVDGLAELGLTELNRTALFKALDRTFTEMKLEGDSWNQLSVQVSVGSSVALTTGFVAWVLRGGALASALLATLPAWRGFDPLPIIMSSQSDKAEEDVNYVDEIFDRVAAAVKQPEMDTK